VYGWRENGTIRHLYSENQHLYPPRQAPTRMPQAAGYSGGVAEINAARAAAGVHQLINDPRVQMVAERHLARCVAERNLEHIGMRPGEPRLEELLTRAGMPTSYDQATDLGAAGTHQSAGIEYIDPRMYRGFGKTHYGELRNPKYNYVGFAAGGGMSVTVLASGR